MLIHTILLKSYRMTTKMRYLFAAVILVFSLVCNAQVTTSSIFGSITSEDKEPVIGANIQALHEPSGTRYGTVTNFDGKFTIQGMRAGGPYKIEVSYIGYNTETIQGVQLTLGNSYSLNIVMRESSEMLDEVVIAGKAGMSNNGAAMRFNSEDLQRLPTISRSISDVTRMNPLVSVSSSGAMSFAGVNNRYNSFQVDGAMNNDVFGLAANGQNGGQAGSNPISIETVDQIQVNVAPFDVRQSGFTGGSINAITKSGTNDVHASAYFFGNNQEIIGSKYVLPNGTVSKPYNQQSEYTYGVNIGGPIIKNKPFFFANYEKANIERPNNYKIGGESSQIDPSIANEVLSFMRENYGYTGNFDANKIFSKSDKAGLKLNWNINDRNQMSVRWSLVNASQLNGTGTATNLYSSDQGYEFQSRTNSFIAELQSKISESTSNEFRASYVRVNDSRNVGNPFPFVSIDLGSNQFISLGNDRSSMANSLDQDIFTITDNVTWLKGSHTLTFGTHNEFYTFQNLFIQDLYGAYYFRDKNGDGTALDEFFAGQVDQFRFQQANKDITGRADWAPRFSAGQIGFYVQDSWQPTNNFNLTYGVRADIPLFIDTPTENAAFNETAAIKGWDVKTNQKVSSRPLWSPRVGFRYRPTDNLLLRGGAGIFTGRIPFVWLSNSFAYTGIQFQTYNINNNDNLTAIYDPNPDKQAANAALGNEGSQQVNVFSDDFKFSQNARFNFAAEYTLPGDVRWTVEGIYSKTLNDIVYQNLSYDLADQKLNDKYDLSFDNRPIYSKLTTDGAGDYSNIYKLSNTSKGYSYNLSTRLEKSFACGLDFMASYSYTQSKSLNSGTSSVAESNWRYNYTTGYSNNPELGFSAFNRPHSVKIAATYNKTWLKNYETTVSLIYTGESGNPYSVYINGDLNGDGANGNDLMFIFTDAQIDELQSKNLISEAHAEGLKGWLGNDDYMKNNRGKYFERYAANKPFEHHFDLHVAQAFKIRHGKTTHRLEVSFDIMNVGNLLNKEWGRVYGGNNYFSPVSYNTRTGVYTFTGGADYQKYTYDDYNSRWRGQLGVKYSF